MSLFAPLPASATVEAKALECAGHCLTLSGRSAVGLTLPIPVVQWIELLSITRGYLDNESDSTDGLSKRQRVLGTVHIDDSLFDPRYPFSKYVICTDQSYSDSDPPLRFTVAHELGHVILDHLVREYVLGREFVDVDTEQRPGKEIEANAFAAALLVPLREFENRCRFVLRTVGINVDGNPSEARERLKLLPPKQLMARVFSPLAKPFGVSMSCAAFRMAKLAYAHGPPLLSVDYVHEVLPVRARYGGWRRVSASSKPDPQHLLDRDGQYHLFRTQEAGLFN